MKNFFLISVFSCSAERKRDSPFCLWNSEVCRADVFRAKPSLKENCREVPAVLCVNLVGIVFGNDSVFFDLTQKRLLGNVRMQCCLVDASAEGL